MKGKIMKLSDAMLKGCRGTKKCIGEYSKGKTRCCALGAAMIGAGIKPGDYGMERLEQIFPELANYIQDDFAVTGSRRLGRAIVIRNDNHGHTRQEIAKWLKSLGY